MPAKNTPAPAPHQRVRYRVVISHDGLNVGEVWIDEVNSWAEARVRAGYLTAEEVPEDAGPTGEGGAV